MFLVLNLNGTKTFMFHITTCAFLSHPKLPSLVISRPVGLGCVQNTSLSDVLGRPTWRPGHLSWNVWEPEGLPKIFIWATNFEVWVP